MIPYFIQRAKARAGFIIFPLSFSWRRNKSAWNKKKPLFSFAGTCMRENNSNRGGGGGKKGFEEKKPLELDFPETEVRKGRSCNFLSLSLRRPSAHIWFMKVQKANKNRKNPDFLSVRWGIRKTNDCKLQGFRRLYACAGWGRRSRCIAIQFSFSPMDWVTFVLLCDKINLLTNIVS